MAGNRKNGAFTLVERQVVIARVNKLNREFICVDLRNLRHLRSNSLRDKGSGVRC
jgi:hypothetical protein